MLEGFNPTQIQDINGAREAIVRLLNLIEHLKLENRELSERNQRLQDEINHLKGEQGKPKIKPNKKNRQQEEDEKPGWTNHSSEKERHKPKTWQKNSKLGRIEIHDSKVLDVDRNLLPKDAEFKGYVDVVVQDINIKTHNILFRKRKYYSVSEGKTYLANLPRGYDGEFGPGSKALAITLYFACNMTEPKILELYRDAGMKISEGQLSNFLIKNQDAFHHEKDVVYEAGLRSSPWQNIDHTATRVNGQNQHCQIVCNPLYTAFFTTEKKTRLTVIDVLRNFSERVFLMNAETFTYLKVFKLSTRVVEQLEHLPYDRQMSEQEFLGLLAERLPGLGPQQHNRVVDAAAVAAYHAQMEFPVVRLLICDDAHEFRVITEELALCWVHDGRHYKKLQPYLSYHRELLDAFLHQYWTFYDQLLEYKKEPTEEDSTRLAEEYDKLFSTVIGYEALDKRIAKTKVKKDCLLLVLKHPEIPLHNNAAELGARKRVRKRDASFGTRTEDGTKAWDTFMTLAATTRKLDLSFYKYIYDRVSGACQMPNMDVLIGGRAEELRLGESWRAPP